MAGNCVGATMSVCGKEKERVEAINDLEMEVMDDLCRNPAIHCVTNCCNLQQFSLTTVNELKPYPAEG
jgi:hypothetical protein